MTFRKVSFPFTFLGITLLLSTFAYAFPVKGTTSNPAYVRLQHASTAEEAAHNLSKNPAMVMRTVAPEAADPAVHRYLRNSYAYFNRNKVHPDSEAFLYLVGTNGSPDGARLMPRVAAENGYRAIALMYNTLPAVAQACDHDPDPKCSQNFRARRVFGVPTTKDIDDTPNESIVHRLIAMLKYLQGHYPQDGWGQYLKSDGSVNWSRFVVSGHSQGAGMAAFIAKEHEVARVVLFSDWDYYYLNGHHQTVPWLSWKSATPADRWWGMYDVDEPPVKYIRQEFDALKIPADHIFAVNLPPRNHGEPHTSVSGDHTTPLDANHRPAYLPLWDKMMGKASQ